MSTASMNEKRRLVDMVIEEVSLVDRAANRKRFLIVKRREGNMENDLNESSGEPESPSAQEQGASEDGALETAADALEQLTQAVEDLARGESESAAPDLHEIAARFKAVAERLVASEDAAEEPAGEEPEQKPVESDGTTKLAEAVEALRIALGPLAALPVAKEAPAKKPKPEEKPEEDEEERPKKAGSGGAQEAVAKQLGQLTEAVGSLAGLFKGQQQRISRMEKSFGLPSSARAEPTRGGDRQDPVSWPLDLNTPVDKESVDGSLSFHD